MTRAFLYEWCESSTNKWYVGSRSAKGCHPTDGYICSSKMVKSMIKENPSDWTRKILAIGLPDYIRWLERAFLQSVDARRDPQSYNKSNADGLKFLDNCGSNNPMFGRKHSESSRKKMSAAGKGKRRSDSARANISIAHIGIKRRPHTEETKQKMSAAMKGRLSPKKGLSAKSPSIETRIKLSLANKKYKPTSETIAKIKATKLANKLAKVNAKQEIVCMEGRDPALRDLKI
jgi:hypothetical protein